MPKPAAGWSQARVRPWASCLPGMQIQRLVSRLMRGKVLSHKRHVRCGETSHTGGAFPASAWEHAALSLSSMSSESLAVQDVPSQNRPPSPVRWWKFKSLKLLPDKVFSPSIVERVSSFQKGWEVILRISWCSSNHTSFTPEHTVLYVRGKWVYLPGKTRVPSELILGGC